VLNCVWIPVHLNKDIVLSFLAIFDFDVCVSILVSFSSLYELYISVVDLATLTFHKHNSAIAVDILGVPVEAPLVFLGNRDGLEARIVNGQLEHMEILSLRN